MMCHRIGRPPISIIGLGRTSVSSEKRRAQTASQQNRLHETLPSLIFAEAIWPGPVGKSVSPRPYNNIDGEASQANACLINWFISARFQFDCRGRSISLIPSPTRG